MGDICFKDSLQSYWRECTWLPLSNPCNQWLPGLSLSLAHFIFHILVFHAARGNGIERLGRGGNSELHVNRATSVSRIKGLV